MNFRDRNLAKNIMTGVIAVLAVCTILIGYSLNSLKHVGEALLGMYDGPYKSTYMATEIKNNIAAIDQNMAYAVMEKSIKDYDESIMSSIKTIEDDIKSLSDKGVQSGIIDELNSDIKVIENEYEKIKTYLENKKVKEARNKILDKSTDYFVSYDKLKKNTENLCEQSLTSATEFKENSIDLI